MLNLGKERLIGHIVLKRSFQMALMSVKNLVYNKLARQNIFCFINPISILVVLTYCYYYYYYYYHYYFYYYYHYYYYFIVIIVIIIIVLSIINVFHFILFHFIFYCSYYYDFCLRVVCDVYVSPRIFFSFLVNDLHFILTLLIYQESFFFCHYRLYHHCHHRYHFFFQHYQYWGRIQRMNSSGMVYSYPLMNLGKP